MERGAEGYALRRKPDGGYEFTRRMWSSNLAK
jgi:hypothetical protein